MSKPVIRSTILKTIYNDLGRGIWLYKGGSIPTTEAMLLGTVAHCLLLEPKEFSLRFEVSDIRKGSKEYNSIVRFGRTPIKSNMYSTAKQMVSVLQEYLERNKHQEAFANIKSLIDHGLKEEIIDYEDAQFIYRIKPDAYNEHYMVDYKTTSCTYVTKRDWEFYVQHVSHDIQVAFYTDVLFKAKNINLKCSYHIVQSTIPPFLVSCFFFLPDSIKVGLERMQKSLTLLVDFVNTPEKVHSLRIENLAGDNFRGQDELYNDLLVDSFSEF